MEAAWFKCEECGKWMENTAGGNYSTCPDGHGKLRPKLTYEELNFIHTSRLAEMLPRARFVKKGTFAIGDVIYKSRGRMKKLGLVRLLLRGKGIPAEDAKGRLYAYCPEVPRPFLLLRTKEEMAKTKMS